MKEVLCIVGKSGTGKTTIAEKLKELGFKSVDSYTTRAPRFEGENGHTFVTQEEFDSIRDDLVAYTKFDKYEYGATRQQIAESDIYVIDPAGVEMLSKSIGRENLIIVYLTALDGIKFNRMAEERSRYHAFERMKHDEKKFEGFRDIDVVCENNYPNDLERNVRQLEWIINMRKVNDIEQ